MSFDGGNRDQRGGANPGGQVSPVLAQNGRFLHLPSNSRLASWQQASARPAGNRAVFLDRDGVLVEDVHFLQSPDMLRILPGVASALKQLQDQFYVLVITNQSGIARGLFDEDCLLQTHIELVRSLSTEDVIIDALYYCPHLLGAPVKAYDVECQCRKPKPGMLLQAAQDWGINLARSFLVGDRSSDLEAACAAGVPGIIIGERAEILPNWAQQATDLEGATRIILETASRGLGLVSTGTHAPVRTAPATWEEEK
jgi:D,D-heptose 1,7-bisphosphate phosphatase